MKIALFITLALAIDYLQAEVLDLNPLISIMADAPVLGVFVWLFALQQKQNEKLIKAIVDISTGRKRKESEE